MTKPEERAHKLFDKSNIPELIDQRAGKGRKPLWFNEPAGRGSLLIRDGELFDNGNSIPRTYCKTVPDFLWGDHFIEVKDQTTSPSWFDLKGGRALDLSDVFQWSLRRSTLGLVPKLQVEYDDLNQSNQRIVKEGVARFKKKGYDDPRRCSYVLWERLIDVIPSPESNLETFAAKIGGRKLPLKILAGTANDLVRLHILDTATMNEWDRLLN